MAATTEAPHLGLGDRINSATRPVHAKLNKNLLLRLPLALPPRAHDPSLYITGLLHVAPIYRAFESIWQDIVDTTPLDLDPESDFDSDSSRSATPVPPVSTPSGAGNDTSRPVAAPSERIRAVLDHLLLPQLARFPSLRRDICSATGWSGDEVDAQLNAVIQKGRLAEFVAHVERAVTRHPHVLLAYAWVLYMALFSGGRFIRGSLEAAGTLFWGKKASPLSPGANPAGSTGEVEGANDIFPLAFFRFETPHDGEDLKIEFKRRLAEVETVLTPDEYNDVVQEAVCIFDNMILLITQLDGVCEHRSPSNSLDGWAAALMPRLGGRLRDSVAVARERSLKGLLSTYRGDSGAKPTDETPSEEPPRLHDEKSSILPGAGPPPVTDSTTDMSSLHIRGALALAEELVEKRTSSLGEVEATVAGSPLKAVRFGRDAPEEGRGRLLVDRGRRLSVLSAWNAVMLLGAVAVVLGVNYIAR
ncbi:hypothetical protein B0H67DRAFT_643111 [Lasiosphaeris hirsuta]|uniref:Heme oxygenase-like protein n=1 Tax=Lasiosphaeris hirsuta TaxID=260670 RepID=A0AA40APU3_9PEZI|nr:hypothetical protein B0H67DRAFT_643111 [Lasiosphaeris hirsuta]